MEVQLKMSNTGSGLAAGGPSPLDEGCAAEAGRLVVVTEVHEGHLVVGSGGRVAVDR